MGGSSGEEISPMDTREQLIRDYLGKNVHVVIDRPVGYDHKGIRYPINYGYIPGLFAGDGEEQDAYILGQSRVLEEFDGQVIAVVCRKDDCEDKFVVAQPGAVYTPEQIRQAVEFQEKYFYSTIVTL